MDLEPSSAVRGSSPYATAESQPRNPYARIPSRRAIACVTCAKAKTKCNKAVPACSRCITKGIACEPRSTRRTSENKNRSNIRKQPTVPRKHHSLSAFSGCDQSSSPRHSPPSDETGHVRSMSYDCYSIVKADEQALMLSGYPVLTPLPTQTPYTANESQLCSEDCEQNQTFSEHAMSNSNLSSLGGLSPPTPEPMIFHEPVPVAHCIDYSSFPQPWCEEVSASIEYDFGSIIPDIVSPDTWTMSNTAITIPSTSHIQWPQPDPIFQQPRIRMEQISYPDGIGTYSGSQSSSEGCFSSPMPDWRMFEPVGAELSTNASTSLLLNMSSGWEDGFVCEPSSYQMF